MTPEQIAEMRSDMAAGTPGPWRESQAWRPPLGNGPHETDQNGNIFWGYSISGSDSNGSHIYPTLAAVHNFPEEIHSNARRIARVPAMEAAILALTAELATARQDRDEVLAQRDRALAGWEKSQDAQIAALDRAEKAETEATTLRYEVEHLRTALQEQPK